MELYDITKLIRDPKQENLYNLFVPTFQDTGSPYFTKFSVTEEKMMRLDLVSYDNYNTDGYVDILCSVNYIDNPLNIMEGDILKCPSTDQISGYRLDDVGRENAVSQANTTEQSNFVDENRKKYVSQSYNITPTSLPEPKDPVRIQGDDIIISK